MKVKFAAILIIYYLAVVIPHEYVGAFLASIFLPNYRTAYNWVMLIGVFLIIAGVALAVVRSVRKSDITLLSWYFMVNIILAIICVNVLFVLNVEVVHFVQYAIFAFICFRVTDSYHATAIISIFAGAGDELFQYIVLTPDTNMYYDFNDVVINAVGVGFGLILTRSLHPAAKFFSWRYFLRSYVFIGLLLFTLFLAIGFITGIIAYGPDLDAAFVFTKERYGFWHVVHPDIKFHIVKPMEALLILTALVVWYTHLEQGSSSKEFDFENIK